MKFPLFQPGVIAATPGALEALADMSINPATLLARHLSGDWGDVCAEDKKLNDAALALDNRVVSAYQISRATKILVVTEHDRSVTTLLLPEDY